jgi:hypothetical protein
MSIAFNSAQAMIIECRLNQLDYLKKEYKKMILKTEKLKLNLSYKNKILKTKKEKTIPSIIKCTSPFEKYGYDEKGNLWKNFSQKGWKALTPQNYYFGSGAYYVIVIRGVQYCFYSHTKVFKEVKK